MYVSKSECFCVTQRYKLQHIGSQYLLHRYTFLYLFGGKVVYCGTSSKKRVETDILHHDVLIHSVLIDNQMLLSILRLVRAAV